ncbi:MAG: hypothetical protein WAV54_16305 [Acidimicrobiales bacterium]
MAAGQRHERVLEGCRFEPDVLGRDSCRCKGEDHGVDQISRAGHDQVATLTLDALHLRDLGQQAIVEGR